MSIRIQASASISGELKEALHEALHSAAEKLEDKASRAGHRVVWDTANISIESENSLSLSGEPLARVTTLSIEALCVEEPTDA